MWNYVHVIAAGNNIYDINNIGAIILLECILFANKEVGRTIWKFEWSDSVVHSNVVLQCICSTIVEENPGLTVYDVVDPSKTVCVDFSQGNTRKFRQNACKQCVATSSTAIIHHQITNINAFIDWPFLNVTLCIGTSP